MKQLGNAIWLLVLLASTTSSAAVDIFEFSSPEIQARYHHLVEVLRCPKCLNQNLAGSDSPISADLRAEIFYMLEDGKSDDEITGFLVERYGVFILYDPPVSGTTLWVWLLPSLFGLVGLAVLVAVVSSAARRAPQKNSDVNEWEDD